MSFNTTNNRRRNNRTPATRPNNNAEAPTWRTTEARASSIWANAPNEVRTPPAQNPYQLNGQYRPGRVVDTIRVDDWNHNTMPDWSEMFANVANTPTPRTLRSRYDNANPSEKRQLFDSLYEDYKSASEGRTRLSRYASKLEQDIKKFADALDARVKEYEKLKNSYDDLLADYHRVEVDHADCDKKLKDANHDKVEDLQSRHDLLHSRMEEVKKQLTCAVCLDPMHEATQLGCGHTTCSDCIDKWEETTIGCPSCRQVHWYRGRAWNIET
jgi:uncharacterized phage infection (PIP) family protein YhgE